MEKFTFVLLSWIIAQSQGQPRIMNGSPANMGQFPYQAYISDDYTNACGASIIHKRWLLTAAHCRPYVRIAYAIVGTIYKSGLNGTKLGFEKFIKHEGFTSKRNKILHDIGLIRLDEDMVFNKYIQPIELSRDESDDYIQISATLSGWGIRGSRERSPIRLQYTSLDVIHQKDCENQWRTIMTNKICTDGSISQPTRGSACIGDSGGALVYKNKQIGVVSYGHGRCGIVLPDVYTRVSSYIPWIEQQLKSYSDKLP